VSLTGFYLYNRTNEPDADYFEPGLNGKTRFADPNDYLLRRRPQIVALNNSWVLSNDSVLTLRYGWTRFVDNSTMTIDFDPSTLGFSQNFLNAVESTGVPKFPNGSIAGYSGFGAITPSYRTYKSWNTNGSYQKLIRTHTLKVGADYRKLGVYLLNPGDASGRFQFDKEFTSSTGLNDSSLTEGNAFASFLLGYPSADSARQSTMTRTTPLDVYTNYYGGYVQDDWRVTSRFTLNYGLRLEHEDGMREVNNNFTVGFDPAASSALSSITIPADAVAGTPARQVAGGLMFAGVDGNKTYQGNPLAVKWSPRLGAVYSLTPTTVLRAGYGVFWAPWNYPVPSSTSSNYGQVGFTQNTVVPGGAERRRHVDQLRRSEPDAAAGSAVLG
jgi:outer membrane receptor protein involved in Fe transport